MSFPIIISVQSHVPKQTFRPILPKPEADSATTIPQTICIPRSIVMPLVPRLNMQSNTSSPKKNCDITGKRMFCAVEEGRLICNICEKGYKNKKQLSKHKTVVHKIISANNGIKCLEDPCRKSHHYFATLQLFRDHLDSFHHIEGINDKEERTFDSMTDFHEWLQKEESQSQSHFVLPRGGRRTANGKVLVFLCNRSGSYIPKGTGKRQLKSQGSQKIGFHCTAGIKVTVTNKMSKIHAVYYKTHYKHEKSLGHLPLSKADREVIAGMLIQGIDADSILYGIKSTAGDKVERKHITKHKDLHNIRKSFGIPNPRDVYKIYGANTASVEEWLQKMNKLGDRNPIIFYKPEGEEHYLLNKDDIFVIVISHFQRKMLESFGSDRICVDSVKNIESFHFELAVVMVVDEFQEPFPVAFCFCSSINFSSMKLFFHYVKSTSHSIKASTFMSDDSPAYYNAWAEIFGPANHRLFSWHVDKMWQDKLQPIPDEDKKEMIGNMLKTLLYELDKNTFHQTLSQFLAQLKEDSDTLSFYEYFINYFYNRIPMWAYCYGKEAPIDADVYIEAFHKISKHAFLVGENKRIDRCVNTLLSHVLDLHFDHESKLQKGKVPFKFPSQNNVLPWFPRRRNCENLQDVQSSDDSEEYEDSLDYPELQNLHKTSKISNWENGNEHSDVPLLQKSLEHRKSCKRKLLEQLNVVSELLTNKSEISDFLLSAVSKNLNQVEQLLRTDSSGTRVPKIDVPVNKKFALEKRTK